MGDFKIRQLESGKKKDPVVFKLRQVFQIATTTLLSLLIPLSFLLLARLSIANHLLQAFTISAPCHTLKVPSGLFFPLFLQTNPINPLHPFVSIISVATLIHVLSTSRRSFSNFCSYNSPPTSILRPRLYMSWIFLCTLQVCVGLGVEGSIGVGIDGSALGHERSVSLLRRIIFFLGLHETTVYWSMTVVKPVVDDTVFGYQVEERWVDRVAMAVSFGSLWWWKLRDEVEALVVVAGVKGEMVIMGVGVADFLGWWLYYLMVTIGMVRVVKGLIWFGVILLCRRVEERNAGDSLGVEDKV